MQANFFHLVTLPEPVSEASMVPETFKAVAASVSSLYDVSVDRLLRIILEETWLEKPAPPSGVGECHHTHHIGDHECVDLEIRAIW